MQKNEKSWGGGEEALVEGALGPGAADDILTLFLLSAERPGHRFTGAEDDATAVTTVVLFLLPRGRPWPRFSTGAPMFRHDSLASAMEISDRDEKP
jgi:hypothetical protein